MQIKNEYNGKETVYNLNLVYFEDSNYYKISAVNENGEEVGYLNFRKMTKPDEIWVYKIETKEEHQDKGYGTAMIDALEFFACKYGISNIEGKYYPSNNKVKPFYEKLGYRIDFDDYSQCVSKWINIKKTYEKLLPKIVDFNIQTIEKEEDELSR